MGRLVRLVVAATCAAGLVQPRRPLVHSTALPAATAAAPPPARAAGLISPGETGISPGEPVPPPAEQQYESPELEPLILDDAIGFDDKIKGITAYYERRPFAVARRLAEISAAAARSYAAWSRGGPEGFDRKAARAARAKGQRPGASPRGATLRDEVSQLGVVFVKLAQTLATRPDIIGEEAAASLESLQDANKPFDDAVAKKAVEEDLRGAPVSLKEIGAAPIAAASLAQVYKATTSNGAKVAVKVRRPGVVDQVSLDCYAVRLLLAWLQDFWGGTTDYPAIVDEVTAGLFRELDFRKEAANAARFWDVHFPKAPYLRVPRAGFARPSAKWSVTSRVHLAEWVDGAPLGQLSPARQRAMVEKGLDVCFLQLFRTNFVHADPHYGNMLYDPEDRLVLLDFGLVTRLTPEQGEAMANAVSSIVSEDWPSLLEAFREIGLVPNSPNVWVDAKTGEVVSGLLPGVWQACSEEAFAASFVEALEKASQGKGGSFTEITTRLTELALTYQFILPPWLLFVVRAVITLDGFAAGMDPPLSALAAAAPHAARRALSPRTARGEARLRAALLKSDNSLDIDRLKKLAASAGDAGDAPDVGEVVRALLLTDVDGTALRRVAYDVDVRPALRAARRAAVAACTHSLTPELRATLRGLRPFRRAQKSPPILPGGGDDLAGDDGFFEAAPVATEPPPPAWRRRRIARLLVWHHLCAVFRSPRALGDVVLLSAASVVVVLRAVMADMVGVLRWRRRRDVVFA